MGFSCTIKTKTKDLTDDGTIHYQLFGLGPSSPGSTEALYWIEDFRFTVSNCEYGKDLPRAAQDCFKELQDMARCNLESLQRTSNHCESCTCPEHIIPVGWDVEAIKQLLAVDPETVIYVYGGY